MGGPPCREWSWAEGDAVTPSPDPPDSGGSRFAPTPTGESVAHEGWQIRGNEGWRHPSPLSLGRVRPEGAHLGDGCFPLRLTSLAGRGGTSPGHPVANTGVTPADTATVNSPSVTSQQRPGARLQRDFNKASHKSWPCPIVRSSHTASGCLPTIDSRSFDHRLQKPNHI